MKENPFQQRLNLITSAEVKRDINNRTWELHVDSAENLYEKADISYIFKDAQSANLDSGCFIGTSNDNALVNCFIHSGSNRNERGFGGQTFVLKMKDGSTRTVAGPWSGRPSIHALFGAPMYININSAQDGRQIGVTEEFVNAILQKFNLPFKTEWCAHKVPFEGAPLEISLEIIPIA